LNSFGKIQTEKKAFSTIGPKIKKEPIIGSFQD